MKINRNWPSIAIIVPAYNEADYIGKFLASVAQSSVQPNEIIICDNGSTDDTAKVVSRWKDLPITLVREPQKGLKYAVERAWRATKSDIILRTDADSVLSKDWIKHIVTHFIDDPDLAACTGPMKSTDGNVFDRTLMDIWTHHPAHLYAKLKGYPLLIGANSAFRRSAFEQVDGYISKVYKPDDQIISEKLAQKGLKMGWFPDMVQSVSSRRFVGSPHKYIPYALSLVFPSLYEER